MEANLKQKPVLLVFRSLQLICFFHFKCNSLIRQKLETRSWQICAKKSYFATKMFSNIAELLFLQKSLGKQYIFKSTNGKKIVTNFGINGKKNHLLIWSVDCKKVILENNICTLNLNLCLNCKIRKFNKCEMNQPKQLLGFFYLLFNPDQMFCENNSTAQKSVFIFNQNLLWHDILIITFLKLG